MEKSGFSPLSSQHACKHPEHYPALIYIPPQGQAYRHVCPACKQVTTIVGDSLCG